MDGFTNQGFAPMAGLGLGIGGAMLPVAFGTALLADDGALAFWGELDEMERGALADHVSGWIDGEDAQVRTDDTLRRLGLRERDFFRDEPPGVNDRMISRRVISPCVINRRICNGSLDVRTSIW